MLAADKLQLQSALKQQATALKEKEFSLHHNNLMTVGTQAAVLAGLDITMFIEFNPPDDSEFQAIWLARCLKFVYYGVIVGAFCANIIVVSHTTTLSVLGGSLALRGPDGSMMTATDSLFQERRSVFVVFGIGLTLTVSSVLIGVWLILHWETALMCWCVAMYTCRTMFRNYQRVSRACSYNEDETVDLRDLFEGVGSIQAIPTRLRGGPSGYHNTSSNNSRKMLHSKSSSFCGSAGGQTPEDLIDEEEGDYDYYEEESSSLQMQQSALLPNGSMKRRSPPPPTSNNNNNNKTRRSSLFNSVSSILTV